MENKDKYGDIVLSPIIAHKGNILRVLYLPGKSYDLFLREDQEYKLLKEIRISGRYTDLENIHRYYKYTSDIKSADELDDIKNLIIDTGLLAIQLGLNIPESEAKELLEYLFTSLNTTMESDID